MHKWLSVLLLAAMCLSMLAGGALASGEPEETALAEIPLEIPLLTEGEKEAPAADAAPEGETAEETVPAEPEEKAPESASMPMDGGTNVAVSSENFPDEYFLAKVSSQVDADGDGYLSEEECAAVTYLSFAGDEGEAVASLKGIEYFTSLTGLACGYCGELTEVDLSGLTALESITFWRCGLTSLVLGDKPALKTLSCIYNGLESLDLSGCGALEELSCSGNRLTELDVSGNTALTRLDCYENELTELDVSKCVGLESLICFGNDLATLDIGNLGNLVQLGCARNKLTSLNVRYCPYLEGLSCNSNQLSALDLSGNPVLEMLYCEDNLLAELNIGNNPLLIDIVENGMKDDPAFYNEAYVTYSKNMESGTALLMSYDRTVNLTTEAPVPDHNCAESLTKTEGEAATCTEGGWETYYTCGCGKLYADAQAQTELEEIPGIDPLEHAYDQGTVTKEASAGETGEITYTCTREGCSQTKQEPFSLLAEIELSEIEVSGDLASAGFDTVEGIEDALLQVVVQTEGYGAENSVTYEVTLMVSTDNGTTWTEATEENFPAEGLQVLLPYPQGTSGGDHDFTVVHMFSMAMNGHQPGETETLVPTETEDGLLVTVTGLSPFAVAWKDAVKSTPAPSGSGTGSSGTYEGAPKTGDDSPIALLAGMLLVCAAGAVALALPRGKNRS